MKKISVLILLIFICNGICVAEESVSLSNIIDIYLNQSDDQKIRSEQKKQQDFLLQNSKANFLPTISSNFKLPGYYHSHKPVSSSDTLWNDYKYLSSDLTITENLPFNADLQFTKSFNYNFENSNEYYNSTSTLKFNYYLFKENELKLTYDKNKLSFDQLNLEQQHEINTDIYELCRKYYDAMAQKADVRILSNKLKRNRKIRRIAEIKYNAGVLDILTYNQIELQYKQTELELSEANKNLEYNLQLLADFVDISQLNSVQTDTTVFSWSHPDFSLKSNPEIQSMQINGNLSDINQKMVGEEFDWYVTVGGEYTWGGNGYGFEQFQDDLTTDDYSAYLGITFPIYDGSITKRKQLSYKSQKRVQLLNIQERQESLTTRWNYLNKMIELFNDKIEVYKQTLALSKNNLQVATGKMLRGEISYSDWNRIEQEYEQNELNLLNKKIELNEYILEANKILGNNLIDIVKKNIN